MTDSDLADSDVTGPDSDSVRLQHLREQLRNLPQAPGIYRMHGADDQILYVGKARSLKQRVGSYFLKKVDSPKTRALVARITHFDVTLTGSETEALLLEQTLIKSLKPPYNILLRDDKSYPYVFLSESDTWPRLAFHRGSRQQAGRYFGPFPSSAAVRESLNLLQKLFQVRQCDDTMFRNRDRPCLQYQIRRCRAPCVGYISEEDYRRDVDNTRRFLEGRNEEVSQDLIARMSMASEQLDFESAAVYRDQLAALRRVQEQQFVLKDIGSADVFAVAAQPGAVCVQVLFVRDGRVLGSRAYFPPLFGETEASAILSEFLPSFYLQDESGRDIPNEVILPCEIEQAEPLAAVLSERRGRDIVIKWRLRETRAAWLAMAENNAQASLSAQLANRHQVSKRFQELQTVLALSQPITRMECFDISHTMGEATVASCVVFDGQGPRKTDYRRFNITDITPGDDYAAMRQALTRRYSRLVTGEGRLPDILLIDGGKGQLAQAVSVLNELAVQDVLMVGVAKGEGRKPGLETLHLVDGRQISLAGDSMALHLIQQIRDEAHRFAITGHRARRAKARKGSVLEDIAGVGPTRRKRLIEHFGGLQGLQRASVADLARVPGISEALAKQVHAALHSH